MNMPPIIAQLFYALWYLVPIALLASLVKSSWFKGLLGEFLVNARLTIGLPKETYHLLKNVTLPTDDGTTQIDHIVVSKYGVFVIETKNMKGWIFGSANQKRWTQKIFRHTNTFQNPLHQNYKHVKTLEDCLGIPQEAFFSVIVFVGDCRFKSDMPENVTNAGGCIKYITGKHTMILSETQQHDAIKCIQDGRLRPSMKTHGDHVKHVSRVKRG